MNYLKAQAIAQRLVRDLSPACERIQIAGSIRRVASEVKDIEILAIPDAGETLETLDLFGHVIETEYINSLNERLRILNKSQEWTWRKDVETARWGPRYKRLRHKTRICCDLFITDSRRWGYQLAIRTGTAMFSKALVTLALRKNYHCTDSLLHQHRKIGDKVCPKGETCPLIIETPEEMDFLEALGLYWIEPAVRSGELLWKMAKEAAIK